MLPISSLATSNFIPRRGRVRRVELELRSRHLGRTVKLTVLLPPGYRLSILSRHPLLLINDGQDFDALNLQRRLSIAYARYIMKMQVVVGIHANEDRMREYGTSGQADYGGRGDKADAYRLFVVEELIPFLEDEYRLRKTGRDRMIAGFSLGGLSAFDIAWRHEDKFAEVGCFSASFWWRSAAFDERWPDADRITIDRIQNASRAANLRYYFMVGTDEEESDRNNNGIIDAIDDTLDVVAALRDRGVSGGDIRYQLVEGGQHNQGTWGPAVIAWLTETR